MDRNIKDIVEIVLEVEKQVQAKADLDLELVNDELAEVKGQRDRQAKTIQELLEKLEAAEKRADNAILESVNAGAIAEHAKQKEEIRRLETLNAQLSEKLNSAQDWIQRQNTKISKLETQPPAEPEWIKPTDDEPQDGVDVLITTARGTIVIAKLTKLGWKNKVTGVVMTDPRAWMALPEPFKED